MTTSPSKLVSVVVPNYNYEKYIKKRLETILNQTYPIYELIILDDASTDDSIVIIERELAKIKEKYPDLKVQFVVNEKNSGKAIKQWKKGFELATGGYVWVAEADDLCSRRFLEEVMKEFDDPEVVLSYAESKIINGNGVMLAPNFKWSRDKEKTGHYKNSYIKDGFREIEEIMAIRCTIPNVSAAVFKKSDKIPYARYFDEAAEFLQVGDWYFYAKVLEHGKISYNKKALNKFRVHKESKTAGAKKDKNHYEEILKIHKMFTIKYNLDSSMTKKMSDEEKRLAKRMTNK